MRKQSIPKVFHQVWIGNKPLSSKAIQYRNSWMTYHPKWEMKLWTEDNMPHFKNQDLYRQTKTLAGKVDIARYELIYKYGGIFIDIDFECFKNIEPLIKDIKAFASFNWNNKFISNGILGAVSSHPAFAKLVYELKEWVQKNANKQANRRTGPHYTTHILKNRNDIHLFKSKLFFPYSPREEKKKDKNLKDAYATHHWGLIHGGERWQGKKS